MKEIKDGGPAFPRTPIFIRDNEMAEGFGAEGATLRQWYVGQALANPNLCSREFTEKDNALRAFKFADAMIAHEEKEAKS